MAARKTVSERIDALAALKPSASDRCVPQISKALKDRSASLRTNALQLIREYRITVLLHEVERLLHDQNWLVRTEAAVCLGDLLQPDGTPRLGLRRLLKDKEWVVRIDAMESLAMLKDMAAMPQIAKLLKDENGIVRSYCATILAENCGRTYKAKIHGLLKSETDAHARLGFCTALFLMGDRNQLPQILGFLESAVYQVRCATVHSLENLDLDTVERSTVIKEFAKLRRTEPTRAVTSTITTALKTLRRNAA